MKRFIIMKWLTRLFGRNTPSGRLPGSCFVLKVPLVHLEQYAGQLMNRLGRISEYVAVSTGIDDGSHSEIAAPMTYCGLCGNRLAPDAKCGECLQTAISHPTYYHMLQFSF